MGAFAIVFVDETGLIWFGLVVEFGTDCVGHDGGVDSRGEV